MTVVMYPEHGRDLFEVFEKSEASFSDYSVTIGVTSYNCKNTIRDCIDSALSQAYPVQEILIIDDHSLDGTRDILLQLAHNTDSITVIFNKQNAGVSAARNQIIQLAKTEFIAFFDDDDISQPNRIGQQITKFKQIERQVNSSKIICHSGRILKFDGDKEIFQPCIGHYSSFGYVRGREVSEAILCGTKNLSLTGSCATCVQLAPTSLYKTLGGFDEMLRRSEDTDFCIRAAEEGVVFGAVKDSLVIQKMTRSEDKGFAQEKFFWSILLAKHEKIIDRKGNYQFSKLWLDFKYLALEKRYLNATFLLFVLVIRFPTKSLFRILCIAENFRVNLSLMRFFTKKGNIEK